MKQLRIALYSLVFFFLARATFYAYSDGFSLRRIEFPQISYVESEAPRQDDLVLLQKIFDQPYSYLAKGSQSYAFISQDKKYILKLFKCHHWDDGSWLESFANTSPLPERTHNWFLSLVNRRRIKVETTRLSFDIVKSTLKDECGVLYIQDTPSKPYPLTLSIIDRAGRKYQIEASTVAFAVQEKAQLVFPTLSEWVQKGETEKVQRAIESLIALMYRRSEKGIFDSDPDIHKNAGFVGTTAIHIDIGSFQRKENHKKRSVYLFEIQKCLRPLSSWITKEAPSLEKFYKEAVEQPENCQW